MKVAFITSNRSEYGLLKRLINLSKISKKLEPILIITGDHLSPIINSEEEILNDDLSIDARVKLSPKVDTPKSILDAMGDGLKIFAEKLTSFKPDTIIILGDRYESLVVATAALLLRIPLIHISGGEITKGSIDDTIRHAITKLSDYHFVATDEFKQRVIKFGEDPSRVFVVGGMGVDSISNIQLLPREKLFARLNIKNENLPLIMCTYHPATAISTSLEECRQMLLSLQELVNFNIVITYPNPDFESKKIINLIKEFSKNNKNFFVYPSLGQLLYLSALSHSLLVIGNSSSGIAEAPYFKCSTINIGTRQMGRPRAASVFDVKANKIEISKAIQDVIKKEIKGMFKDEKPYGEAGSSALILKFLEDNINKLNKKESFI